MAIASYLAPIFHTASNKYLGFGKAGYEAKVAIHMYYGCVSSLIPRLLFPSCEIKGKAWEQEAGLLYYTCH